MKITAKILTVDFSEIDDFEEYTNSLICEFENGLILLEMEDGLDRFFRNRYEIKCDNTSIQKVEDTDKTETFEAKQLEQSWKKSFFYFQDESCKDLIAQLLNKNQHRKPKILLSSIVLPHPISQPIDLKFSDKNELFNWLANYWQENKDILRLSLSPWEILVHVESIRFLLQNEKDWLIEGNVKYLDNTNRNLGLSFCLFLNYKKTTYSFAYYNARDYFEKALELTALANKVGVKESVKIINKSNNNT